MQYEKIIETFFPMAFWDQKFSAKKDWGDRNVAREYLEKYLLSDEEYYNVWKPLENKIFITGNSGLPELVFAEQYNIIALSGGKTFDESDFRLMQECMHSVGNKYFVIVEHPVYKDIREVPPLRMKFPIDITWKEICSGNFISSIILESPFNEYYIYGDTDAWGEYIASEYDYAFNIIGFESKFSEVFNMRFRKSMIDWEKDTQQYLPVAYLNKLDI